MWLQEFAKLLNGDTGVARDAAHRESINGIVAGYGQDALPVAHDDVFSLTHDLKSSLFQRTDSIQMIYTWKLRQG